MSDQLSIARLCVQLGESLGLEWLAGESGKTRTIKRADVEGDSSILIGNMNLIHSCQIQVVGERELVYLQSLDAEATLKAQEILFSEATAAIIIAGGITPPENLLTKSNHTSTPLLGSCLSGHRITADLHFYLTNLLTETLTLHGVFMKVYELGVFIAGESGIGKSELALELISRGHKLIADDAPTFSRRAPGTIEGLCPQLLQGYLEVRGLGILDIRRMFGDTVVVGSSNLDLIISLIRHDNQDVAEIDRLSGGKSNRTILEIKIPEISLPVATGRNLAVLVEAASRNHILTRGGYNSAESFIENQRKLLDKN